MDGGWFDAITKRLAANRSRRGALRLLGGGALAGLLAPAGEAGAQTTCKKPGDACTRRNQCCSGRCSKRRERCQSICAGAGGACGQEAACGLTASCECFTRLNGKSFCGVGRLCSIFEQDGCLSDADCDADNPGSVCVAKACNCASGGGFNGCVLPC